MENKATFLPDTLEQCHAEINELQKIIFNLHFKVERLESENRSFQAREDCAGARVDALDDVIDKLIDKLARG